MLSYSQGLVTGRARLDHMSCREAQHVVGCMRTVSVAGMLTGSCGEREQGDETNQPRMVLVMVSFVHSRGEKQFRSSGDEVWTSYMRGLVLSVGCACRGHRRRNRTSTVDCCFRRTQRSNCSIHCCLFRFGICRTRRNTISYVGVRRF